LVNLHPLVKFAAAVILMLSAGIAHSLAAELFFLLLLILLAALISLKNFLITLKPFSFLFVFTFLVQIFITADGYFTLPTLETLPAALLFTAEIFLLIGFSVLFVISTPEMDILRVLRFVFYPLKLLKISPEDLATASLIALRFIPILRGEAEKIADSQRILGLRDKAGGKAGKTKTIKATFSMIIPQFVRSLYYAAQIAVTLRYRGGGRDFFKLPPPAAKDYLVLAGAALLPPLIKLTGI
jgi:energy-coupling factor transporter transmembrane protein EcfT